jgi:hypothetical protein
LRDERSGIVDCILGISVHWSGLLGFEGLRLRDQGSGVWDDSLGISVEGLGSRAYGCGLMFRVSPDILYVRTETTGFEAETGQIVR